MARQGPVGEFEQLVLLSVLRLQDNAYGVTIRREIERCTGRTVARGAVYTTLDRLVDKNVLASRLGSPEEGDSHKRFYSVTREGIVALQTAAAAVRALWSGLESIIGER